MRVLLGTCGAWYLPNTAKGLEQLGALAGLWISDKNRTHVAARLYKRSWPFHLSMKPYYHFGSQIAIERAFYRHFPIWRQWVKLQKLPECQVVQSIMGYATEFFDLAEQTGALKVVDCQNSHPTSYQGYWQRECDQWCPGEKVPIPDWMFARMDRELKRADLILCPSVFVRDTMVTNGLDPAKCVVHPFGVDTTIFQPRSEVPEKIRFITVGTICLRKGHHYLFRAFEQVKRVLPNAELVCVGAYKCDFRLERPKWEGTFTHLPSLTHPELAALLRSCTAFVLPSLEEGFARVIPEAMASGLPVIASYESGATTLITHGESGWIVDPKNPKAIAEAMIMLASKKELNRDFGIMSLKIGRINNSWNDYSVQLLEKYKSFI